jgi:hypothetical protein
MPALSNKTISEKLFIKPGKTVLLVNAPAGYARQLGKLPAGAILCEGTAPSADIIQVFVGSEAELREHLSQLKKILNPGGALWVTYHKGTSKTKTDINRDSIAAYANTIGMEGVAIMSVDDDWSALRLKVV